MAQSDSAEEFAVSFVDIYNMIEDRDIKVTTPARNERNVTV
jgi:hypothetical protein